MTEAVAVRRFCKSARGSAADDDQDAGDQREDGEKHRRQTETDETGEAGQDEPESEEKHPDVAIESSCHAHTLLDRLHIPAKMSVAGRAGSAGPHACRHDSDERIRSSSGWLKKQRSMDRC